METGLAVPGPKDRVNLLVSASLNSDGLRPAGLGCSGCDNREVGGATPAITPDQAMHAASLPIRSRSSARFE